MTRGRWLLWGLLIHATLLLCAGAAVFLVIYGWENFR